MEDRLEPMALTCDQQPVRITGAWGAVFSMALAAFVLIASEFMPVSLLPLVAHDLAITEGQTGQAISISGLFAVLTSLVVVHFTRRIDRRLVASGFTSLLVVSGVIVAFAPNYPVLMLGRVLLGIAIGGFWSMSTSIVMRLRIGKRGPEGTRLDQWRQRAGGHNLCTSGQPARSLHRLAQRILPGRSHRPARLALAVDKPPANATAG